MSGRYKAFISSDGMEILVGNRDRDNDYLTFKVSSPQDFWLHVADNSGAHVIVRNENKVKRLPKKTLQQAASLAAYHSQSRPGDKWRFTIPKDRMCVKRKGHHRDV